MRDIAYGTVQAVPRFVKIVKELDTSTTHVVSTGPRTMKVLLGVAKGLWVLSPEWVLKRYFAAICMSFVKIRKSQLGGARVAG